MSPKGLFYTLGFLELDFHFHFLSFPFPFRLGKLLAIVSSNKFSAPVCLLSCDPFGLNVSVFAVVPQAP